MVAGQSWQHHGHGSTLVPAVLAFWLFGSLVALVTPFWVTWGFFGMLGFLGAAAARLQRNATTALQKHSVRPA